MKIEDYEHILLIAQEDVAVLEVKGKSYGSSWRNRGGVGAFMMLARKWDRIENQCEAKGYDIFEAIKLGLVPDGLLDDIRDLRRYLLLVDSHMTAPKTGAGPAPAAVVRGKGVVGDTDALYRADPVDLDPESY
jgi:hypothetical protein